MRIGSHFRCVVAVLLTVTTLAASEHHGVVKFGGLPLPGATVTATRDDKRVTAIADEKGEYSFKDLADGAWNLQVEMLCFAPLKRDIEIKADGPADEWDLTVLPMAEIKANEAPVLTTSVAPTTAATAATTAAATETKPPAKPSGKKGVPPPTPSNTSSGFQRTDLNASRDAAKVQNEAPADAQTSTELNRNASDGYLINGSSNNGASSPFAQSQAFGNFRRGGRSLYTGGIGITLDNSTLDARPYSLNGQNTPKPDTNRLVGLLSFGGPLKIPHLLKNGPNIFATYQWLRNRNANTPSTLMPTALQRIGDFSQTFDALGNPVRLIDPLNGQAFSGNMIPSNRISDQAKSLLRFYPLPNFTSTRYNYQIPLVGITHQDSLQVRVNKSVTRRDQITGNFNFQSTRGDSPNIFDFLDTNRSLGINTGVNWSHRFGQRIFLSTGFQFSRLTSRFTPNFAFRENVAGEAGITGNNQEASNWGPPALNFSSGIQSLSDGQNRLQRNQTSGLTSDLLWSRNPHTFRFGFNIRHQQFNYLSQQDPRGTFTFTGAAAGNDFAGFLLGVPDASAIAYGNADKYFRAATYESYINDDWRFSSGLTLNLGVRWEYSAPITELYGRLVNLDIVPGFGAVAPVVASNPRGPLTGATYPDSLVQPDKHAFQPRLGLAWRPLPASSLVIRAGYSVAYNTSVYQSIAIQMAQQSPLSKSLSVSNTPATPLTLANGFSALVSTPNTFALDPDFRVGYAQTWNASIQRDLPAGMQLNVSYLGIKGTRGQQEFLPNTYPTGGFNPCPNCPHGFAYLASNGNSTREAGTVQVRRRLHSGFTATMQYTYAKAIDDSALGGQGGNASVIAQDWLNLSAERARSSFDQRHLLTINGQYTSGMGMHGGTLMGGWRGALLKEWTLTTVTSVGSGLPLTPVYSTVVAGTGFTGIRPDYIGGSVTDAPPGFFLNRAAYAIPVGHWGNAGRDSINGPSQFSLGGSLSRAFRLTDRYNLDVRVDAANALNHVTYASYVSNINSSQFGLATGANGMRTVQTTVRLRF